MGLRHGVTTPHEQRHKWIIGSTVSTALALAGLLTGLQLTRVSGLDNRMGRLEDRVDRIENRLRAVEIGLAEVKMLVSGGRSRLVGGRGPTETPLP